jgi:hypothetical protein
MANYFVTLEQDGEAYMQDTRFAISGRMFGSRHALPAKMGLTAAELDEYLPVLGIPFSAQRAVFRELAQTKHYSFTTSLSVGTAVELGWPSDE